MGSGKSTVCHILAACGAPVYVADDRAKVLLNNDPSLRQGVLTLFGPNAYNNDEMLNRAHLARRAFADPSLLEQLNALVHPAVQQDFAVWRALVSPNAPFLVKEAAIMLEADTVADLDVVVLVYAPKSLRLQRTMTRDGASESNVLARMSRQWSDQRKINEVDYVVYNDGRHLVIPQVLHFLHRYFKRNL